MPLFLTVLYNDIAVRADVEICVLFNLTVQA